MMDAQIIPFHVTLRNSYYGKGIGKGISDCSNKQIYLLPLSV